MEGRGDVRNATALLSCSDSEAPVEWGHVEFGASLGHGLAKRYGSCHPRENTLAVLGRFVFDDDADFGVWAVVDGRTNGLRRVTSAVFQHVSEHEEGFLRDVEGVLDFLPLDTFGIGFSEFLRVHVVESAYDPVDEGELRGLFLRGDSLFGEPGDDGVVGSDREQGRGFYSVHGSVEDVSKVGHRVILFSM